MRLLSALTLSILMILSIAHCYATSQYNQLSRATFNQLAQETNVPLFWVQDSFKNNRIEPKDVVYLWGLRPEKKIEDYIRNGKFTPQFARAYEHMVKVSRLPDPDPDKIVNPERKRRALVIKELEQARPTLLKSDFSQSSSESKQIVTNLSMIGIMIDDLYQRQNGVTLLKAKIPADDAASRTLFYRNQGPFCLNPLTENNPDCNAIPSKPKRIVDVYPAGIQSDLKFCTLIQNHKNAKQLIQPFAAVVEQSGDYAAQAYQIRYQADMHKISDALKATAAAIQDPKEASFKNYLLAAADSFITNDWYKADESWTKMSATNSKWYLRIAPDETYWDPCNLKAGFHMSFATINQDSIIWQSRLDPLKNEMEQLLAQLAGPPYKARKVDFHLPDFIDIVLNAGDSRSHTGGTLGQSLPNTGPVANEGRGRTVVMANLSLPDEDAKKVMLSQASSLFCPNTMKAVVADRKLDNMSTVLHEAAHNLGPAHEYQVNGKKADEIFGGQMASMLEELKAQTSALYFLNWLVTKNMITGQVAEQTYLNDIKWAFGHISRGMYNTDGSYKTYSQLAAIQFGTFVKSNALVWHSDATAANGTDKGCFEVDMPKLKTAIIDLETRVLKIKSQGDKTSADALRDQMVDKDDSLKQLRNIITERILRAPAMTFVYSIKN